MLFARQSEAMQVKRCGTKPIPEVSSVEKENGNKNGFEHLSATLKSLQNKFFSTAQKDDFQCANLQHGRSSTFSKL